MSSSQTTYQGMDPHLFVVETFSAATNDSVNVTLHYYSSWWHEIIWKDPNSRCQILLWQQAILVSTDFRQEGVALKLLQDLGDKQSSGPGALHHFLDTRNSSQTRIAGGGIELGWSGKRAASIPVLRLFCVDGFSQFWRRFSHFLQQSKNRHVRWINTFKLAKAVGQCEWLLVVLCGPLKN